MQIAASGGEDMEEPDIHKLSFSILWILAAMFAMTDSGTSPLIGPEHKLYRHLFNNYIADSRPVKNASHVVVVKFDLSLNQLLDLDEKNQILTTSVWIYEEWTDEMLKWSPSDYDDQRTIMIPASSIWLPDIFIFNTANANMDGFVGVNGSKVAIQYNGNVKWMVPLMVSSVCSVDVTYFPYDRQICTIKFGSWIYDDQQLEIVSDSTKPDLEHYVMNSEYDLRNVSISGGILDSSCCPGNGQHSMIELKIELGRKSLYYDYIVIAPTIMLCVLTLASFLLPCDRGEKMAIGLTVFLTLYVLQLRIADNVPDTNSTPILGVFLLTVMTFNCVSLIMATIVMNIKKRGDDNPPPVVPAWFFCLCHNVFGRVVCTRYLWKDQIPYPVEVNENDTNQSNIPKKSFLSQGAAVSSNHSNTTENSSTKPNSKLEKKKIYSPAQENQCRVRENSNKCRNEFSDEINTAVENAQFCNTTAEEHAKYTGKAPLPDSLSQALPSVNNCCSRQQTCFSRRGQDRKTGKADNASSQFDTCGSYQKDLVQPDNRELSSMNNPDSDISKNYLMKRRWFYVAEVVDKFLFIVYLMLLTFSIFTILFLIPVYFRKDK